MSRTIMGFQKVLWNFATYGLMPHGKNSKATVEGEWSDGADLLRKGDILGIAIWHERGHKRESSVEQWRVTKVESESAPGYWGKRARKIKFERIEP